MPINKILAANNQLYAGQDSLKYLGHASIKIKTSEGVVIYIDPFKGTDYQDPADLILVTHQHFDHNAINLVNQKFSCMVITNNEAIKNGVYQSFSIGNIKIDAVAAYNNYHPKAQCVGYIIESNSVKIYHAGDTGKINEMADLAIKNIDYALLPMDGTYTMTPEEATQAANMINAKYDIPIHTTSSEPFPLSDAIVARFTAPGKLVVRVGESIELKKTSTSVDYNRPFPSKFNLEQNYPNPFNPSTVIRYQLPMNSQVSLKIYDLMGREVATLILEFQNAGLYDITWNAGKITSGIYYYKLVAGSFVETKKLTLLK
jgi:L-ascorbate metabolism protein UlaG (beta-lactamase superfamily)